MMSAGEKLHTPEIASPTHTIAGEVDRILFTSEDASYCVVRFHDEDGNPVCARGPLGGVAPGQHVVFSGKWENHKEYGRQLRVETFHITPPVTPEGIIRYLSSGVLPGVGGKTAEAIVHHFGAETLHVLDHASKRLSEVPGLGRKKVEAIRKAWRENNDQRDLRLQLESFGITPAYFKRITELYKEDAPAVIREDPYRLSNEVKGIGFLLADRIAEKVGIGKADPRRMVAGVSYAFSQMKLSGHVCMPSAEFVSYLAELLSVEIPQAEEALRIALLAEKAVRMPGPNGSEMIYEPVMMHLENELPFRIAALLRAKTHAGTPLLRIPTPQDSKFSDEQIAAVQCAGTYGFSILTGGPGVGKTTVISELTRRAKAAKVPVTLAAPTGRAAKRMEETTQQEAKTIHRLLKWDPGKKGFVHNKKNPLPEGLYVIDESSMLDILLAVALFRAIPPGSCIVMAGDPDQLPSVGPGNVLNDLIDSGICPVSRLTKIFRQGEGSGIIRAAHNVNAGRLPVRPGRHEDDTPDFFWIEKDDPEDAADVIERLIADRIPARFGLDPVRDIQLLCPMNRGVAGTYSMNKRLQQLLNPHENGQTLTLGERVFQCGDKVMQTVNNYDKNVFNGDMGYLVGMEMGEHRFTVDYDGKTVDYDFADADQIVPAYAVTVHKSQGCEFPAVVMPMLSQHYMMLQRNLLYTGITRAKKLMVLVGSCKAVSMAVRNAVRAPRYSLLLDKLKHEVVL